LSTIGYIEQEKGWREFTSLYPFLSVNFSHALSSNRKATTFSLSLDLSLPLFFIFLPGECVLITAGIYKSIEPIKKEQNEKIIDLNSCCLSLSENKEHDD
jgi:hypothetical protein